LATGSGAAGWLLLGATAFGVLSVLAALSASPEQLIASRALLGIAGATLAPSTLSLIFVLFQDPGQRSTAMMIDLRLFQNTAFNAALATNLLGIFIAVGYFLFVAQYLQLVLGLSPLEAGLWSLPSAVGFIVGSNLAPRLLRWVRPAPVIGSGLAMAAIGLAVFTQVGGSHNADLAILAGASLVVSLGLARCSRPRPT
jgi:DHA2 family multidrug resistance protein-like MFS transporter